MRRGIVIFACTVAIALCSVYITSKRTLAQSSPAWPQWGQNPQHTGSVSTAGQAINRQLAEVVFDPFSEQEQADSFDSLLVHYQAPLLDGNDVFMEFETGTWQPCEPPSSGTRMDGEPCGPNAWHLKTWHQKKLSWVGGGLVQQWDFESDWKPEPNGGNAGLGGWEPVYHAVLANGFVYDPGFGGTIFKLDRDTGAPVKRINPFDPDIDSNTFVAGPLSADSQGNIYYNVIKLADGNLPNPWLDADVVDSWLVKVAPNDSISKVRYSALVRNAPTDCAGTFSTAELPWPPSTTATPPVDECGSQRPGVNVAPAIAADDGTIYTVSRAHFNERYSFLVAVNSNLTLKWAASLRDRINDGCGVLVPIASNDSPQKGKCRFGANSGVDPATNDKPAGRVIDQSSSSPTVLPDGSVLYGAYTRFNIARGHLFKFSSTGQFQAAFDFGWDTTPAVYSHGGTYSIVIKDNHYDEEAGFYCNPSGAVPVSLIVCASTGIPAGPFYITQLNANLQPEWQAHGTETKSCTRNPNGTITCDVTNPFGFEWCINAPAIDGNGVVYANSEDGNLYAIPQGRSGVFDLPPGGVGTASRLFLKLALGAAYTPLSIAPDGKIYTENDGHLFVIGQ